MSDASKAADYVKKWDLNIDDFPDLDYRLKKIFVRFILRNY